MVGGSKQTLRFNDGTIEAQGLSCAANLSLDGAIRRFVDQINNAKVQVELPNETATISAGPQPDIDRIAKRQNHPTENFGIISMKIIWKDSEITASQRCCADCVGMIWQLLANITLFRFRVASLQNPHPHRWQRSHFECLLSLTLSA